MTDETIAYDGVIKSRLMIDSVDEVLHHERTQPTADLIYERNQELRKNNGVIKDLGAQSGGSFGRMVASIPEIDMEWAKRNGYDLFGSQIDMVRFLQTERGRKCLVRDDPLLSGRKKALDLPINKNINNPK